MIASMLQACGYKVGLYTSPHLIDIRERICVGGEMIPYAEFGRLIRLIEPIAARMRPTPTYFDVLTAAARIAQSNAEAGTTLAVIPSGFAQIVNAGGALSDAAKFTLALPAGSKARISRSYAWSVGWTDCSSVMIRPAPPRARSS